jgi:peptidoglycan/xylan/chitin deacetylase (PgdA/CDA1 family)
MIAPARRAHRCNHPIVAFSLCVNGNTIDVEHGPRSLLVAMALLSLSACAGEPPRPPTPSSAAPAPSASTSSAAAPASVGANELGVVPVLMYHRLVAAPASVYDRTPEAFRAELVRLAEEGYVPVTAGEYTAGDLDLAAGTHPVVLTFDDGDPSQLAALPIMREVAARYPGFRAVATFYVNSESFGDPGALARLHAAGMEIGNHTATHANLGQSAHVQEEIAGADQVIRAAGGEPTTLALPFGIQPDDPEQALAGSAGGVTYRYRGAFLVGANPAPSPYATDFDPAGIPRIRSQDATGPEAEFCSTVWLDKLAAAPDQRYTSDGDPARISYPTTGAARPAAAFTERAAAY